jgi:hypothetical protein
MSARTNIQSASATCEYQKETIEDYISGHVENWDDSNSIVLDLVCGYGPPLKWKVLEFKPLSERSLVQLQYSQDTQNGASVVQKSYSPPFALPTIAVSDEQGFENFVEACLRAEHLHDLGWACFAEESQVDDFQARLVTLMCQCLSATKDIDVRDARVHLCDADQTQLQELLKSVIRSILLTYLMGHSLTITEDTLDAVIRAVRMSPRPTQHLQSAFTSPRLASRQFKFFFSIMREKQLIDLLNWLQQTLHSSVNKARTWASAFVAILGLAICFEESQRLFWVIADSKLQHNQGTSPGQAHTEAFNACTRLDEHFRLLVALFQFKYRSKQWSTGSFGPGTPHLSDDVSHAFLTELRNLLLEKGKL